MDWSPHIIVKAEDAQSIPTSVTALKTFDIGFPDTKATVHCIGSYALDFCKQWAAKGGHKLINHVVSTQKSQLQFEIVRRSRMPVVLIAGTTVFHSDMSGYSTPKNKLFSADIVPAWNVTDKIINIESVEKTIIFVAKPIQVSVKIEEITKSTAPYVPTEGRSSTKWGSQVVVMCGKIYKQTSGIFNMIYNYDPSLMSKFSSKTTDKYDTSFGGTSISFTMASLEKVGRDTSKIMEHLTAAMNEDWEGVKGIRDDFLEMIK